MANHNHCSGHACKAMPFMWQLTKILAPWDPDCSRLVYTSMGSLPKPCPDLAPLVTPWACSTYPTQLPSCSFHQISPAVQPRARYEVELVMTPLAASSDSSALGGWGSSWAPVCHTLWAEDTSQSHTPAMPAPDM